MTRYDAAAWDKGTAFLSRFKTLKTGTREPFPCPGSLSCGLFNGLSVY